MKENKEKIIRIVAVCVLGILGGISRYLSLRIDSYKEVFMLTGNSGIQNILTAIGFIVGVYGVSYFGGALFVLRMKNMKISASILCVLQYITFYISARIGLFDEPLLKIGSAQFTPLAVVYSLGYAISILCVGLVGAGLLISYLVIEKKGWRSVIRCLGATLLIVQLFSDIIVFGVPVDRLFAASGSELLLSVIAACLYAMIGILLLLIDFVTGTIEAIYHKNWSKMRKIAGILLLIVQCIVLAIISANSNDNSTFTTVPSTLSLLRSNFVYIIGSTLVPCLIGLLGAGILIWDATIKTKDIGTVTIGMGIMLLGLQLLSNIIIFKDPLGSIFVYADTSIEETVLKTILYFGYVLSVNFYGLLALVILIVKLIKNKVQYINMCNDIIGKKSDWSIVLKIVGIVLCVIQGVVLAVGLMYPNVSLPSFSATSFLELIYVIAQWLGVCAVGIVGIVLLVIYTVMNKSKNRNRS